MAERRRLRAWGRSLVAGFAVSAAVLAVSTVVGASAQADDSSAVTVTAREQDSANLDTAPFPNLEVSVSQTKNLVSQAVTVSWKGAGDKASTLPSGQTGGENFLQIMQCWGDDGANGPERTTCQYGGFNTDGAKRDRGFNDPTLIAQEDRQYSYVGSGGFGDQSYTGIPFQAVNGTWVKTIEKENQYVPRDAEGRLPNLNNNAFFTQYTTNEIPWAGSTADGSGSVTFEVQTTLASPGLGCGAVPDGETAGRSCWLVVVPRGAGENIESGLFWENWKHRLAVRLDFQPVGVRCAIGSGERQLAGTEIVADAISSWQPNLCTTPGGSAYTLLTTTDSDAAAQANTVADAPLALTSLPIDTSEGASDNLTYAPIALTSVAVTFAIDRAPLTTAPEDAQARRRQPFTEMKLTPRLLAKLLTSSYLDALPSDADRSHLKSNPRNLLKDPEFLRINDTAQSQEWANQAIVGAVADIMVPQGRSGYVRAIWSYILADAEARDFLAGKADPDGMIVNPYASTDPAKNPTGSALELPRDDVPKVDPTEAYAGTERTLNSVTWRPYTNDLASGAYYALRGDGLSLGAYNSVTPPYRWTRAARNLVGDRAVIALTDTSSADRYETVTAQLRNQSGVFVAPTTDSMLAAAAAMNRSSVQPQTVAYDAASPEASSAASAYPLTLPVYAATNPRLGDPKLRASYADFIRYAVADGQQPGVQQGQLPEGYAPLPQSWRDQALVAANTIEYGPVAQPSPSAPTPGSATSTTTTTTPPRSSAGTAPAVAAPAPPSDPSANGQVAGALSGATTPEDPALAGLQSAVPVSILAGLAAALAVPFVGRLRRRL